tara:strand:+ start:32168 stop:32350 length:183 start_codon:yes stop_codon:yes gene_type:complete
MKDRSINWLKKNKPFLNVNMIEKELHMPKSTLQKALSGVRELPENWLASVNKFVQELKTF